MKLTPILSLIISGIAGLSAAHPVPESESWLTFEGKEGPGSGKHVVLIAADQEYRSEQAMPMMARILAEHHGFNTRCCLG